MAVSAAQLSTPTVAPSQNPGPNPGTSAALTDLKMLRLAREIAMDIRPLEAILVTHEVTLEDFDLLRVHPTFTSYLRNCIEEWASAQNTAERVRLKSLAIVEESLPEFYARAHDPKELLQHKIKTLEVIAKFAGIGDRGIIGVAGGGEKLSITINLGEGRKVTVEHEGSAEDIEDAELADLPPLDLADPDFANPDFANPDIGINYNQMENNE